MGEVIEIKNRKPEEDTLILCEICDAEDRLCLTFFVYEDGTFKCSNCGSSYVFNEWST